MKSSSNSQSNRWLIIFLIYADFTTIEDLQTIEKMKIMLNSMLGDIITTPINNSQSRMFIIFNSILNGFDEQHTQIDNKTAFFTIKSDNQGNRNYIESCEVLKNNEFYKIGDNSELFLHKADLLANILKKTAICEDEEVFLNTWGHGSAFGIFRKETPKLSGNSVRKKIKENLYEYPYLKLFWEETRKANKKQFSKNKPDKDNLKTTRPGDNLDRVQNSWHNKKKPDYALKKESELVNDDKAGRNRFIHSDNKTPLAGTKRTSSALEWNKPLLLANELLLNELSVQPKAAQILSNNELNESLEKWLCGKKIAVLLMSNCWMMNLHTMYTLKDSVRCLVAPQGNIDIPGYNLKDIISEITMSNAATFGPTQLAVTCVKTFDNEYSRAKALMINRSEPQVLEMFKIFAVDLSKKTGDKSTLLTQIELLKNIIDLIYEQLTKRKKFMNQLEMKYFLKYVRSACFDFSEGKVMMIDIINWIRSINYTNQQFDGSMQKLTGILRKPIQDFENSVSHNSIVLAASSGKNVYCPENPQADFAIINLPPTAYSLFFPIQDCSLVLPPSDYINLKANVLSDQLLKTLPSWRRFLKLIDPQIDKIFRP